MSNNNKIFVFTDVDLDGVTSLLVLHWVLGAKPGEIPFISTTVANFRKEFLKWAENDSINNYDKVYFLDLDTSTSVDLVDNTRSHIFDHHITHVNNKHVYKSAFTQIVETTSCAKVVYSFFKPVVTDSQKYLIGLGNDYDSYQFKLPDTYNLNCLFTNTQKTLDKTRSHKFIERFYNGFTQFNSQENAIIKNYITDRDNVINNLNIFTGYLPYNNINYKIVGTMSSKFVNDVCDHLIKHHQGDIVFSMNTNNNHVSWRKNKNTCPIDLSKLSAKLTEGGGHEYAAGGKVTEKFMEFTKTLTQEK